MSGDPDEIPDFLKRTDNPKGPPKPEVKSMARISEDTVEAEAGAEAPAKAKPAKARAKANGAASKPAKAAKAAPKKGAKPKTAAREAAPRDKYGFREGSLKSQAASMYASKGGATLEEVKDKTKSVQLNLLKDLEAKGHKVKKVKEDGEGKRQVTRYFLS